MARFTLSRRSILQDAGMASLALPILEVMGEGRARAAKAPPRYVVMYAGMSLTRDFAPTPNLWWPKTPGPGYEIPRDLTPLGRNSLNNGYVTLNGYDVQNDVSIVTGLKIPWATGGQGLPRAGRIADFHGYTMNPLLCGMTAREIDSHSTPSSDQIVASNPSVTFGTKFPSLQYGVQADTYVGSGYNSGNISYGNGGRAMPPQVSPTAVFKSLSPLIAGSSGMTVDKQAQLFLDQDRSILDHLVGRVTRLKGRLGKADQHRLDGHFEQIRNLETLLKSNPVAAGPSCHKPDSPPPEPPLQYGMPIDGGMKNTPGYGGEAERAPLMRGFLYLSLACNLTRVASHMITYRQSYMSVEKICGFPFDVHNCGHYPPPLENTQDVLAWHVEQFAWLARQLKNAVDVDGSPMLDNTVIILCTEGGAGVDPVQADNSMPHNHSTENMSMLVAGGRNLGLRPGRNIPGNNAHPASVLRRCMKAVGVDQPLGEVDEAFADL